MGAWFSEQVTEEGDDCVAVARLIYPTMAAQHTTRQAGKVLQKIVLRCKKGLKKMDCLAA